MSEKKQNVSGYTILKQKIAKKDEEIATLKSKLASDIETLQKDLSLWKNRYSALEKHVAKVEDNLQLAIKRMGWFRRFIFGY